MPKFDPECESRILRAISMLPKDGIVNLKAVAREHQVEYDMLRRRWYSTLNTQSKGGHNTRLSEA